MKMIARMQRWGLVGLLCLFMIAVLVLPQIDGVRAGSGDLTVTISSTATSPTNTSPIPMTATFSEAVTGFELVDITVGNGTADNFTAGSGTVYTFDVTPSDQGAVTVDVAAAVAQGAALNDNTAATQFSITYDSVAPTVTLTSMATSPTETSPIPMTATFSENVTGFELVDITVGNGTAGTFVASSTTVYAFDVTPTGLGAVTVDVAGAVAQDAALNPNTAATQYSITYVDTVAPTVTLSSTATSPTRNSPIPMTATFSEAVTGFAVGDITVGNCTADNFTAGSGTAYTFDVTPTGQGAVTVDVAGAVAQDAALNPNTAATQYSITYDSVAPTVTLTAAATSPTSTAPIPMTATFNEAVTGFVAGDITVVNGEAVNFVGSGTAYAFDVTPAGQGAVTVNVAAAVAQDSAANPNTAAMQYSITYDSVAPTVTLTAAATSPTSTAPIPMTATFNEAVTGFVAGDITVVNGTADNFAGSGTVYTFDVTPTGLGAVTVNVAAAVAQDAALNPNTAAAQYSITYDSTSPTVTLTSTATSPTRNSPIHMTATFSEAVTGFVAGDITVVNGTVINFAGSGTAYTFDVTPTGQGAVTVNVAAAVAQDAAVNGNTAATQYSITYDSTSPTVTLTSTATSPTRNSPIPMTATFSEAVTGFVVGDITVGNGTAGNFVAVSTTVYTFNVTPTGQGAVTVNVAAGKAQDAAVNGNTAATRYSITYDSLPTITSFTTSSADEGDVVIITGTNFTGATAVKFGDTDALSFTVDSDTQITAVVRSGTSGKITVTTAGGTATSADDFTPPASSAGSVWLIVGLIAGVVLIGAITWSLMRLRPNGG